MAGSDAFQAALAAHLHAARTAYPEVHVDDERFAAELARRLGDGGAPAGLVELHGADVYLAIACADGDAAAMARLDADFLDEVERCAHRLRATADQAADARAHVRRILFVSEPGRPAAAAGFTGKGDLRAYVRVIATRELLRVRDRARREPPTADHVLELLSPAGDAELAYLRDHYRAEVDLALRTALAGLAERDRALLRYHLLDGWSIDRIGALYGVHRATAARWVGTARDALGEGLRADLAHRLALSDDAIASMVRLVRSRIDVSLSDLL